VLQYTFGDLLAVCKVVNDIFANLFPQLRAFLCCFPVASHAGISKGNVKFISNQLDTLLRPTLPSSAKDGGKQTRRNAVAGSLQVYGTGEEQHASIIASCDSLSKLLRSAVSSSSELPLSITSVNGVSPAFRFAEVTILYCLQSKTGYYDALHEFITYTLQELSDCQDGRPWLKSRSKFEAVNK